MFMMLESTNRMGSHDFWKKGWSSPLSQDCTLVRGVPMLIAHSVMQTLVYVLRTMCW